MIRIAVDAMGGDRGPRAVVRGAMAAARDLPIDVLLVGPEREIAREVGRAGVAPAGVVRVLHAPDVVEMGEAPASALRRKPGASVRVAAEAVRRGDADALFTVGHTGAAVVAAHGAFGMLDGVDRPALATVVPTRSGAAVLLDAGANAECRPQHLVQFALMGELYARTALAVEHPRVGLLSIGEEATKGNDLTREAHRLLKDTRIGFIGNVDAQAIYSGVADVVVCDGFTGNVALKISEGLADLIDGLIGDALARRPAALPPSVGGAIRRLRRRLDYSEYGGAPLVGVNGLAVVGHGRSSTKAVRNGVALAYRLAARDLVGCLRESMAGAGVAAQ